MIGKFVFATRIVACNFCNGRCLTHSLAFIDAPYFCPNLPSVVYACVRCWADLFVSWGWEGVRSALLMGLGLSHLFIVLFCVAMLAYVVCSCRLLVCFTQRLLPRSASALNIYLGNAVPRSHRRASCCCNDVVTPSPVHRCTTMDGTASSTASAANGAFVCVSAPPSVPIPTCVTLCRGHLRDVCVCVCPFFTPFFLQSRFGCWRMRR